MPIFDTYEQTVLRSHAEHVLISLCDIYRSHISSDGAGGTTAEYTLVLPGVKCRLSPVRNDFEQERVIAERLGASITWILSIPYGTDVRLNDVVRIAGGLGSFDIMAILTYPRSIATVMRLVVLETK